MKLRFVSVAVGAGMLFLLAQAGFCQNTVSMSEWVAKSRSGFRKLVGRLY